MIANAPAISSFFLRVIQGKFSNKVDISPSSADALFLFNLLTPDGVDIGECCGLTLDEGDDEARCGVVSSNMMMNNDVVKDKGRDESGYPPQHPTLSCSQL